MQNQPATLTAAFHALAPGLMAGNGHGKGPGYSSALYRQTGHFVTGTEMGYVFLMIIAAIVVTFIISGLRSS
jgi:hypothetical protein